MTGSRRTGAASTCALLGAALVSAGALHGQEPEPIEAVVLHPIMNDIFMCSEHAAGELSNLGDEFGKDCLVVGMVPGPASEQRFPGLFRGDGVQNEDWFGWEAAVLAPCDGSVTSTSENPATNRPGEFPDRDEVQPASEIRFACSGGVNVVYAHVRNIRVSPGDPVSGGDVVAAVGNNAVSKAPHVHIGAWKDETPLQIRFDLRALGDLRRSSN